MGILDDIEGAMEKVDEAEEPFIHSLADMIVMQDVFLSPNGVVVHVGKDLYTKIKRWRKVQKASGGRGHTLTFTGSDEKG